MINKNEKNHNLHELNNFKETDIEKLCLKKENNYLNSEAYLMKTFQPEIIKSAGIYNMKTMGGQN